MTHSNVVWCFRVVEGIGSLEVLLETLKFLIFVIVRDTEIVVISVIVELFL